MRLTVLLTALLLTHEARAGGFEVAQQGAAAGGTAHAGTALVDRAESAWFNPAALADGAGLRVSLGLTIASSTANATSLPGAALPAWSATTTNPLGTPPYAYLSYAQGAWVVALAANAPFGGGVRWPDDWPGRFEILESRPLFFRVSGSLAWRFGPVAIGAGVHLDTGGLLLDKATDHVTEEGRATLQLRATGAGGDAYLHARIGAHATLGASYKSRTPLSMLGEADFDVPPPFRSRYPDQAVFAPWTLPDRAALAFAWTEPLWGTTVEAGLTVWGVNQELALDFEEEVTDDVVQVNAWRTALVLRAGAWGQVHDLVTLRGGLYVDGLPGAPPNPAHLSPSSPDSTRLGATLGLGVIAHRLVRIDAYGEGLGLLGVSAVGTEALEAHYAGWAVAGGLGLTVLAPPPAPRAARPPRTPRDSSGSPPGR